MITSKVRSASNVHPLEHHEEGQMYAYSALGVQAGQNSKNFREM